MKELKDQIEIMLDLETTGVTPGCGILSIGAVSLDFKHRFYQKIRPDSNKRQFLELEPPTMAWWDRQSQEAKDESLSGTLVVEEVLHNFQDWFIELNSKKVICWGLGADFDVPILRTAYKKSRIAIPDLHARCFRTIRELYPEIKAPEFVGVRHSALADARNQAEHLNLIKTRIEFIRKFLEELENE